MIELTSKLNEVEFNNEFTEKLISSERIFDNIHKVCGFSHRYGCGSYLITGTEYKYNILNYQKQKLLFEKAKTSNNILEIGTYMGHSLLIMLLANPNLKITTIDMVEKFSKASTEYLQKEFPNSQIQFIKGNSLQILPELNDRYDLFHIDGSHSRSIIKKEFEECIFLSKDENMKIVFDDYETCRTLNNTIDRSFNVKDSFIPNCESTNRYLRIMLKDKNELQKYIKIFRKIYVKEYLKELPKRALNFKAIYNKIVVAIRHIREK